MNGPLSSGRFFNYVSDDNVLIIVLFSDSISLILMIFVKWLLFTIGCSNFIRIMSRCQSFTTVENASYWCNFRRFNISDYGVLWLSEISCEFVIEYIDHRIELAYAQHRSQCVASGAIKSVHSNKHNNDNFHLQTRWQVYQTEIDMKVTLKTGTGVWPAPRLQESVKLSITQSMI